MRFGSTLGIASHDERCLLVSCIILAVPSRAGLVHTRCVCIANAGSANCWVAHVEDVFGREPPGRLQKLSMMVDVRQPACNVAQRASSTCFVKATCRIASCWALCRSRPPVQLFRLLRGEQRPLSRPSSCASASDFDLTSKSRQDVVRLFQTWLHGGQRCKQLPHCLTVHQARWIDEPLF